ncbi:LysM peptidoglycan-binding domain-containing protein [Bacteroides sp. 519]|uniref:LysM peptidoglycan-binding domain-containing protein n=1 Tax=Bacteroides sp. 519 TaxID=2302937 RepID=UPI0013D46228|nr:LysM peptidoglycan-binding domain-containing protein [Bacteroides sp. 519]NDV58563.1 LysM peptidoglycan-binding domain-containing protein [Bacteroides sp. 519]
MKSLKRIFFIIFLSGLYAITIQAQENITYFLHKIEKGQSLYSISIMYGVSQNDIIKLNPGCEEKIYTDQTLKIPQVTPKTEETPKDIFHTIQAGETLYRITKIYNVTAKDITDENPGLSAANFRTGEVIRIPAAKQQVEVIEPTPEIPAAVVPRCREMHKVKRKETIFSVSRSYNISEEELITANPELKDGMKKGQLLCIPFPAPPMETNKDEEPLVIPSNTELFKENQEVPHQLASIKAALILPFIIDGDKQADAARMIEYYEGFLMAVDSLKKVGVSMDIHVYNSGNKQSSINAIIKKPELKNMDIIFGPLYQEHVKPLSDFADENNIRLVIPVSSRIDEVYQNPLIYQINPPQSYLYSEVYEHFVRNFRNANVIILDMGKDDDDKTSFLTGLKTELNKQKIPVQTLSGNSNVATLRASLKSDKQNIFIPSSESDQTLVKILPTLELLAKDPKQQISLFGYPKWQTYTKDHLNSFFELDTYFYSSFYTNNLLPRAINFINSYHKEYSKEMINIYPKYGMLGYDTGFFFLSGLAKYGTGLEANISKMDVQSIQTGFKFERVNNWGGFINKKVFFIHFDKNYELTKLDFD